MLYPGAVGRSLPLPTLRGPQSVGVGAELDDPLQVFDAAEGLANGLKGVGGLETDVIRDEFHF